MGRERLNHTVKIVYDALRQCHTVTATTKQLNCSRAYIYKVLKANGMTPADVIKEHATKDTRLLQKGIESD